MIPRLPALAVGLCLAFLAPAPPALAQDAGGVVRQGQNVVTRVYSISDLLEATGIGRLPAAAPDPAQGGGFGGAGGFGEPGGGPMLYEGRNGRFSPSDSPTPEGKRAAEVAGLIRDTVDSDSWRDNGGTLGSLTYVPWTRSLVVTHTPATQEKIAALLEQLAPQTRMVTTQVMLAPLDAAAMEQTEMREGLLVFTGEAGELQPVTRALLVGYDGEEQSADNSQGQTYVSRIEPVVAAGAVGYGVSTETLTTGLSLRVTPRIAEDGESVRMTLVGQYTVLMSLDEIAMPTTMPAGDSIPQSYQIPQFARSGIDARASLPTGQWTIVAGFGGQGDGPPLHLLVRVDASGEEE